MKIKDMKESERPRERLIEYGSSSLSNEELLSIILKDGTRNRNVKEIALDLLNSVNNLSDLKDITLEKLISIKGIGKAKALSILSAVELGKRIYTKKEYDKKIIFNNSKDIFDYMKYLVHDLKQECFFCLYLNTRKELIERKLLFMGTVNKSSVHPREVMKHAYLNSASAIICIHNHPTGDIRPSNEDIRFTRNLYELSRLSGIYLLDHIIIGNNDYYSFSDEDMFNI